MAHAMDVDIIWMDIGLIAIDAARTEVEEGGWGGRDEEEDGGDGR